MNRRDDISKDAATFNPDRESFEYIVPSTGQKLKNMSIFGFGAHECLGKREYLQRGVFAYKRLAKNNGV